MIDNEPILQSKDRLETLSRLMALAAKGLVPMFDESRQIFCHTLRRQDQALVPEGISRRYTIITLLGLLRLEEAGSASPIAIRPALDALLADLTWLDNIGDLGLLLWLSALAVPERTAELTRRLDVKTSLRRFADAQKGKTMHLAWFLTGLSYAASAQSGVRTALKDLANDAFRILVINQGKHGTFGRSSVNGSVLNRVFCKIGSFADQVYPIYALAKFSSIFGDREALQRSLNCAKAICAAQGPLGQWWWHYGSESGTVSSRFPVYSVHQHAMAPMALLAIEEASSSDFTPWIFKGLGWIQNNELSFNMEDASASVVWRCITPSKARRLLSDTVAVLTRSDDPESRRRLKVLFECRPYELGWLLYAFATWSPKHS